MPSRPCPLVSSRLFSKRYSATGVSRSSGQFNVGQAEKIGQACKNNDMRRQNVEFHLTASDWKLLTSLDGKIPEKFHI